MKTYYHFTSYKLRDGRPIPPIGEWLVHDGEVVPCVSGLHASEHPSDALAYAPGVRLHKVNLAGDLTPHGSPTDKWAGRRRRILASIDATDVLRRYARRCALAAVKRHWKAAPDVVIRYLKTGDGTIRAAAYAAAAEASRAAADNDAASAARAAAAYAAYAAYAANAAAAEASRAAADNDAADAAETKKYRGRFKAMVEAEFRKQRRAKC